MTQPFDPPPAEISYASVRPTGNAALLVRIASIFNYITAGCDVLAALLQVGMMFFFPLMMSFAAAHPSPGASPATMPAGMTTIMAVVYGVYALLAFASAAVAFMAAQRLRQARPSAFGWGLAAGIVNCFGLLWCSLGCVIPLGFGIYTIVILCLEHVRAYLNAPSNPRGLSSAQTP